MFIHTNIRILFTIADYLDYSLLIIDFKTLLYMHNLHG